VVVAVAGVLGVPTATVTAGVSVSAVLGAAAEDIGVSTALAAPIAGAGAAVARGGVVVAGDGRGTGA
jgi:hypothetical protein